MTWDTFPQISTSSDDLSSSVLLELDSILGFISEIHHKQGALIENIFPYDSDLVIGNGCIHSVPLVCNEQCQVVATTHHYMISHDGLQGAFSDC